MENEVRDVEVVVDQVLYVVNRNLFTGEEGEIKEYVVRRVTEDGVFARQRGKDFDRLFAKKSLVHRGVMQYLRQAYIRKEDYVPQNQVTPKPTQVKDSKMLRSTKDK